MTPTLSLTDLGKKKWSFRTMDNQQLVLNKVKSVTIISDDVTYHPYLSGLTDLGEKEWSFRTMENQQILLNKVKSVIITYIR